MFENLLIFFTERHIIVMEFFDYIFGGMGSFILDLANFSDMKGKIKVYENIWTLKIL